MARGRCVMLADCVSLDFFDFMKHLLILNYAILDYAKLIRKRDKAGGNGDVPRIDMETLRASARAADIAEKSRPSKQGQGSRAQQAVKVASPMEPAKPLQHHQGSFQLSTMLTSDPNSSSISSITSDPTRMGPQQPQQQAVQPQQQQNPHQSLPSSSAPMSVPPPPWATTSNPSSAGSGARGYAPDHLQPQSFVRSSHHT